MNELMKESLHKIKSVIKESPRVAVVLGSGNNGFEKLLTDATELKYSDIPNFPVSTIVGHSGKFVFGYMGDVSVVAMCGRVHFYEGYTMNEVVYPIRILGLLGVETIVLTNAAGSLDPGFKTNTLMMIHDHISCFIPSPLLGRNDDRFGERFPDMSEVYDKALVEKGLEIGRKLDLVMAEGVYCQLSGPQYETPAEIRMLAQYGVNAVGMSTVCEAIVARHMGIKVVGVSRISNLAAGMTNRKLSHTEVVHLPENFSEKFAQFLKQLVLCLKK